MRAEHHSNREHTLGIPFDGRTPQLLRQLSMSTELESFNVLVGANIYNRLDDTVLLSSQHHAGPPLRQQAIQLHPQSSSQRPLPSYLGPRPTCTSTLESPSECSVALEHEQSECSRHESNKKLLGTRTLPGARGLTTRSKKLVGTKKGIATRELAD